MDSTDSRSSWTATLASIEREGERVLCGGGARLPSAAAKAAGWGLAGLEFGINIPGTAGGAVRMNANAYGGQLARVLEWVEVATAGRDRAPRPRAARLLLPALEPARRRSRLPRRLPPPARRPGRDPGDAWRRCASAAARPSPPGSRPSARPSRTPTTTRAEGRSAGQLLDAAGCRGLRRRRRPLLREARQLRRELRRRQHRRRAGADGRGTAAGPRATSGSSWSRRSRCWATSSGPSDWEL